MAEHVNITMKKMNPFALPVSNLSRLNLPTGGGSNAILRNNAIQVSNLVFQRKEPISFNFVVKSVSLKKVTKNGPFSPECR